jgi:hypothetical protein
VLSDASVIIQRRNVDQQLKSKVTLGSSISLITFPQYLLQFLYSVKLGSIVRVLLSLGCLYTVAINRLKLNGEHGLYSWTMLENHISLLPTFKERSLSYAQTHFWYIFKLIYPRYLSFDYGYACIPTIHSLLDPRNLLPIATYLSVISLSVLSLIKLKFNILVSILLIVLPLTPALNILFPVGTVLAERLLFMPSAGYCLIVAEILIWNHNNRLG